MSLQFIALVLAGNRAGTDDTVAKAAGVSCKALADVGGTPMIERVMAVLRGSGAIEHIIVSLPESVVSDVADGRVDAASSPVRSLLTMLDMVEEDKPILVTTADHALLSPPMIQRFTNQYDPSRFDLSLIHI